MHDEKFLVTGALGCIGAWVVRNLVQQGTPVVALDLGDDNYRHRWIMSPEDIDKVQYIQGDITDLDTLEQVITEHGITHIIHLAALLLPACNANPIVGAQVNVIGGLNLFEAARRSQQIKRIVYASSIAVYDQDAVPTGDTVQHETVAKPVNLYGVYKQSMEGIARCYWHDHQISSIGLRPGTVFGVGRDNGITSAPTKAMLAMVLGETYHIPYGGRGEFQYADDVAKTFIMSARAPFEDADTFNLHGSVVHMRELIETIENVTDTRDSITFDEPGFPSPEAYDDSTLRAVVGELPCTPLAEAVSQTVEIFRQQVTNGMITSL